MTSAEAPLDELSEGLLLVRADLVVGINAAAGRILGAEPAWARGKRLITVVRDHRVEAAWLRGQETELEIRGRTIRIVPVTGGLALRDVTEARRAHAQARELLAVLSHELRTPMTTVRATLEAVSGDEELPASDRKRLLDRAIAEADRVVRLLDDLTVDVAPPRQRTTPLLPLLDRVRSILAPTLEARRVELQVPPARLAVWADPDKILQLLINLVENAALHGPAASVIEVGATAEQGWVRLAVRDRGDPLPQETLEGLFEPFARGGSTGSGRGLGLYVVRSIAEGWGGTAWARPWVSDDPPAQGNEFGVTVPLAGAGHEDEG